MFEEFDRAIREGDREVFLNISYETMCREALQVNVVESTRSFRMTAYDQYIVKDDLCYPKYYQFNE